MYHSKKLWFVVSMIMLVSLLAVSCSQAPGAGSNQSKKITIAYGSDIDPADIADLLGVDTFSNGKDVNLVELTEDSAVVAGLIKGEVQVGNIGLPDAIKAVAVGVPLKIIMPANMVMEFVLIGQPGIKTVEDLKGKKVAYHAPGSGTEILPRMLVRQSGTITEDDVEWIILPESPNRAAAMQADRIDVTALEFADVLTLMESGKQYEIIASFADIAPEAISSAWVTTPEFADANVDLLKELAVDLGAGYKEAANNKDAWMTKAKSELTEVSEDRLSQTYDFYKRVNNFPQAPYFTQDLWDKMNAFYTSVGEYEDPAPYDLVLTDVVEAANASQQ